MFALNQKPSSERKGDHEVVEGACVTIKTVLSSSLRTLPQSLRDSSLSEGAFEKVAAILFVLAVGFLRATNGRPYNVWCGLACRHIVGSRRWFLRAIRESPLRYGTKYNL